VLGLNVRLTNLTWVTCKRGSTFVPRGTFGRIRPNHAYFQDLRGRFSILTHLFGDIASKSFDIEILTVKKF